MAVNRELVIAALTAYVQADMPGYEGPWPLATGMSNELIDDAEKAMLAALEAVAPALIEQGRREGLDRAAEIAIECGKAQSTNTRDVHALMQESAAQDMADKIAATIRAILT